MPKYFATFPQRMRTLRNHWVEIEAPDYQCAHETMMRRFGSDWGRLYPGDRFKSEYFPGGALSLKVAIARQGEYVENDKEKERLRAEIADKHEIDTEDWTPPPE